MHDSQEQTASSSLCLTTTEVKFTYKEAPSSTHDEAVVPPLAAAAASKPRSHGLADGPTAHKEKEDTKGVTGMSDAGGTGCKIKVYVYDLPKIYHEGMCSHFVKNVEKVVPNGQCELDNRHSKLINIPPTERCNLFIGMSVIVLV